MSTFEFISVLLSIVVGLALTRLLSGVGRALEIRRRLRFYWVQAVWVANVALLLVYAGLHFLLAVLILPTDLEKGADLEAHFFEVRPWFFTLLALATVAEFGDTLLHGGLDRVIGLGPPYWVILISGVTLSLLGARTANRRFHAPSVSQSSSG